MKNFKVRSYKKRHLCTFFFQYDIQSLGAVSSVYERLKITSLIGQNKSGM